MTKEEKKLNQLETKAYELFLRYEEALVQLPDSSKENIEIWDKALEYIQQTKEAWEKAEAEVEAYSDEIDEALSFPEITSYGNYDVPPDSQCPPNSLYIDSHENFLKRKSLHSKPEEQVQRPVREFFNS